jgi:photosystem II stability/assembly factor-like uncharacterized protein
MRRWSIPLGVCLCALAFGCHREVEMIPLQERTIYLTDRFYDVQALSKDRAIVVGYGGKIVETTDGGRNWTQRPSGTDLALYGVKMVDDQHGWIVGQDGLILATADGGKTWQPQESNATFLESDGQQKRAYLFNLDAVDANTAWAVGDRSMLVSTTDGGKTWRARKVEMESDLSGGQSLAAADPIFYDVRFADAKTGWIVGEFGKVMRTTDGGETWREQTKTLMDSSGGEYVDLLDLPTLFGVDALNPSRAVAAGLEAHIAATEDGTNWAYEKTDAAGVPLVDPLYSVVENEDGTGWAIGAAGSVVKRDPATKVWKRTAIGQDVLTWLRSVQFSDEKNGWMVGGFGLIFHTTDGGKTWLPCQG